MSLWIEWLDSIHCSINGMQQEITHPLICSVTVRSNIVSLCNLRLIKHSLLMDRGCGVQG